MGDIPERIAAEASRLLRTECVPILIEKFPWIEEKFQWDTYPRTRDRLRA